MTPRDRVAKVLNDYFTNMNFANGAELVTKLLTAAAPSFGELADVLTLHANHTPGGLCCEKLLTELRSLWSPPRPVWCKEITWNESWSNWQIDADGVIHVPGRWNRCPVCAAPRPGGR